MRCEDIMNRQVKSLREQDTAQTAAKVMRDQNIGFLPVCAEDGKLLGTITDRDIVVRLAAENGAFTTPVGLLMSRNVVSCLATDELGRAELLMQEHRKSRVICTDEVGNAVGVISLSDIARHEESAQFSRLIRAISSREAHRTTL
jgi:CBS domain-containing protein